jgi:cell division inhibitor SepF
LAGIVNKLKNWVGLVPEIDDEEEFYDELFGAADQYEEEEEIIESPRKKKSGLKVVSHPKTGLYEVMVSEPKTFEESLDVVNNLRERKSIVLNLHLLDAEQSQRVVDFVSGATHALDGHQQRIGEGVFIFTPNNVSISAETEKAKVIQEAFWNQA